MNENFFCKIVASLPVQFDQKSEGSDLILEGTDSIPVGIGLRLEVSDLIVEGVGQTAEETGWKPGVTGSRPEFVLAKFYSIMDV